MINFFIPQSLLARNVIENIVDQDGQPIVVGAWNTNNAEGQDESGVLLVGPQWQYVVPEIRGGYKFEKTSIDCVLAVRPDPTGNRAELPELKDIQRDILPMAERRLKTLGATKIDDIEVAAFKPIVTYYSDKIIQVPSAPMLAKNDTLYVIINGHPSNVKIQEFKPKEIFGIQAATAFSFEPSTTITKDIIVDDEIVAYQHENTIWINRPLTVDHLEAIQKIVLMCIIDKPFDRDEEVQEKIANIERDNFIGVLINNQKQSSENVKTQLEQKKARIQESQRQLRDLIRDVEHDARYLEMLDSGEKELTDKLRREYASLRRINKIKSVHADPHAMKLTVMTEHLYCENPKTHILHDMGEYKIDISLARDFGITWNNKTRKINGKSHPHVDESGRACMGNFAETVPSLIAKNELVPLIIMCLRFIESVNVNDAWGEQIRNWPEAKDADGNKIKTPDAKKSKSKKEAVES